MSDHRQRLCRWATVALVLAWVVVLLGAYTRLRDAGLGCPDWPGCYGMLWVAKVTPGTASHAFPEASFTAGKAWAEMIHRYVASILVVLVLYLAANMVRYRKIENMPTALMLAICGWIALQAALGAWTVTLRLLPQIVMFHLLSGFVLLVLLALLRLRLSARPAILVRDQHIFRGWALLGFFLLLIQIGLGGWVSSNYAALVCPDFPGCLSEHSLSFAQWSDAFHFVWTIGPNYQGGHLDVATRMLIHMVHRIGALLVATYLFGLLLCVTFFCHTPKLLGIAKSLLVLLCVQLMLGVLNVVWVLPLPIAVLHNGVAALLLMGVAVLNERLWVRSA